MTTSNIIYKNCCDLSFRLSCCLVPYKKITDWTLIMACKKTSITLFKFLPFWILIRHFVYSQLSFLFAFQLYITSLRIRMEENPCCIIWNTISFKCYEPFKIHSSPSFYFNQPHQIFLPRNQLTFLQVYTLHQGTPFIQATPSDICNNSGQRVLEHFQTTYGGNHIWETNCVFLFNWRCWHWSFLSAAKEEILSKYSELHREFMFAWHLQKTFWYTKLILFLQLVAQLSPFNVNADERHLFSKYLVWPNFVFLLFRWKTKWDWVMRNKERDFHPALLLRILIWHPSLTNFRLYGFPYIHIPLTHIFTNYTLLTYYQDCWFGTNIIRL